MLVCICTKLLAQQNLRIKIINVKTKMPVTGATVNFPKLHLHANADTSGLILFSNLPKGKYEIECDAVSYQDKELSIELPYESKDQFTILLDPFAEELEGVTVISTRSNRSINNTPTRAEIISDEEIHEEGEMRPGDIKMLLSESTGVQTQQTSATSGNASIRLQGLDGRYTQILRDGFPLYAGAASGLGLLQTPPLDLRQVEIIKGSASTLYGGGAIAGLINLISKTPTDNYELNFHLNGTSAGGLDVNSFYSERFKKTGVTFFVSRNTNKAFDPAGIGFSAIPKFERYTVNPKLFVYFNDNTKLNFGINTTFENRLAGDIQYIEGRGDNVHSYFEKNKTARVSTQLSFDKKIQENKNVYFKNSISFYKRVINARGYDFNGKQVSSFTETGYTIKGLKTDWVAGVNFLTDHFSEEQINVSSLRNYSQNTLGAFIQNTWNATEKIIVESGLRVDHVSEYGFAFLPRVAFLFKISPEFTSRIGGGLGYKAPTIFTEETETLLYKNVLPVNAAVNKLERSYGLNGDLNYRISFGQINASVNQLFFYTVIQNPLVLSPNTTGQYILKNLSTDMNSKGAETNIRLTYHELALYLGYTFTDTKNPLTPKHRLNEALVYEIEGKWKFGSELYYFSKQTRGDGSMGRGYWLAGFLAEKLWKKVSVYVNFENIGDTRQTKFENIYTGSITNPVFKDIYAPLDGFGANWGIKIKF